MKKYILVLFTGLLFSQDYNVSDFNTDSNLQLLQKEVALKYQPKDVLYYGNEYFFKVKQPAYIDLYDSDQPLKVLTNYNLVNETFDIKTAVDIFKLSPNKVRQVNFANNTFVSVNGKFYELLYKSELGFQLVAEIFIKVEIPYYTPGIQPKPDPKFRKVNELKIRVGDRLRKIDRNKGFVSNMFGKNNTKLVKEYIKSNKVKVKDPNQLGKLIENFYNFLSI